MARRHYLKSMPTPIKANCPDQPLPQRPSSWGFLVALAFLLLPAWQLQAVQQIFWPNYQWPPTGWYFTYTNNAAVVYFTNNGTVYSTRQFVFQPTTYTSIVPPATNTLNYYSNTACTLSFQISTNWGTNWYSAQGSGQLCVLMHYTNSPMYIQMTNSSFNTVTSALGTCRIRASASLASPGLTLLAPTSGGYLISGFINAQLEGFGSFNTWRVGSTNAYLELAGTAGTVGTNTPITLQISQPSAGHVQVCWPTQTNYNYQVQTLGRLGATNWVNLGTALSGSGATLCQSYTALGGTNLFYRVVATNTLSP